MNTKQVSEITGKCFSYCSRWAKNNGVERVLIKGIWAYEWKEEDIKRIGTKKGKVNNARLSDNIE